MRKYLYSFQESGTVINHYFKPAGKSIGYHSAVVNQNYFLEMIFYPLLQLFLI
jgi:hypothetical protein